MSGNSISFNDKKTKESDFYKNKKIFNIDNIDVSTKETYGKNNSFKYFIGYNDNDVIILDHYIYFFHKRLAMLINLTKIK